MKLLIVTRQEVLMCMHYTWLEIIGDLWCVLFRYGKYWILSCTTQLVYCDCGTHFTLPSNYYVCTHAHKSIPKRWLDLHCITAINTLQWSHITNLPCNMLFHHLWTTQEPHMPCILMRTIADSEGACTEVQHNDVMCHQFKPIFYNTLLVGNSWIQSLLTTAICFPKPGCGESKPPVKLCRTMCSDNDAVIITIVTSAQWRCSQAFTLSLLIDQSYHMC